MKNRKKANIILATLVLIFILLAFLKRYYGETFIIGLLIFVVEAALVGSIADWFAVTALFERPLGLPIKPIIPSNREKILNNLCIIINDKLLNMNYIQNTIEKIPVSKILIGIVEDKPIMNKINNFLLNHILKILSNLKNDKTKLINYIKEKVISLALTETKVSKFIDNFIKKRFTKETYCSLLDKAIVFLSKKETYTLLYNLLDRKINAKAGTKLKFFGGIKSIVDMDKLTEAIIFEGIDFLRLLQASDEKYYDVQKIINRYSHEYLEKADLSKLLEDFINNFEIEKRVDAILTRLESFLMTISDENKETSKIHIESDAHLKAISDITIDLVKDFWKSIRNDPYTLDLVDTVIKELIIEIIAKNRMEFSSFVEERIKGFSDAQLSKLIQDNAGEPLHWIRINGAMLGAMLGVVFFSFINFLYEPFVLPLAHKFIGLL